MTFRTLSCPALALAVVTLLPACGGSSDTFTAPTATFTDTLSGTVQPGPGNTDFKNFTTQADGEVDATLTAAGPPTTIFMGFALGAPSTDGTICVLSPNLQTIVQAGPVQQLPPATAPKGTYCVAVVDVGNATNPIDWTATIVHH